MANLPVIHKACRSQRILDVDSATMAGGNNARERYSWPMMSRMDRMLLRAQRFEAEDAEDIPEVFRVQQPRELKSSSRVSLHKVKRQ